LLIIKDIEKNKLLFQKNELLAVLSGTLQQLNANVGDLPTANELDDKVNPSEIFQILDADSSQQEAIEAAKKGLSFVLQGPPGTGKSQTIANIIAEFLATGKKVLFVSQKAVALDVVYERLAKSGLGDYCLEVHNYKKKKTDVIKDLGRSLSAERVIASLDNENKKRELRQIRDELNAYPKELHKQHFNFGRSLYQITGELAKINPDSKVQFNVFDLEKLSIEQFEKNLSVISELTSFGDLGSQYNLHPWKGAKGLASIEFREKISSNFMETYHNLSTFEEDVKSFAAVTALNHPKNWEDIVRFSKLFEKYQPEIFTADSFGIVSRLSKDYTSISKYLKRQYWRDKKAIEVIANNGQKIGPTELNAILKEINTIRSGAKKSGLEPPANVEINQKKIEHFISLRNRIQDALEFAGSIFESGEQPEMLRNGENKSIGELSSWFQEMAGLTDLLPEWTNFSQVFDRAIKAELGDFLQVVARDKLPQDLWVQAYKYRVYDLLADKIIQSSEVLKKFRGEIHLSKTERFKELDRQIITDARAEIRKKLQRYIPEATWVQAATAETTVLKKELNKKRGIMPLRKLFAEIPNLILTLRPCLMMSPLSVSQLLDPNTYHFDLAIFDEASQIPPEFAIGSIVRASQVIVAGDRNQLPPTRFFWANDLTSYDENNYEAEDYESILNACDAINMPSKMLTWHYRSEDESLIAFSNYHFYDQKLHTFPKATASTGESGLEFVFVLEGIYQRGKGGSNPVEAKSVAELVLNQLKRNPELSLGVIAFSQSQRLQIEDEIEKIKKENPELSALFAYGRGEQVFIKNLETVQGDERDLIIFSVGYGKDELGKFAMHFGPLNQQGGERRLNVAATRARKKVIVVASIQPEDIDLSKAKSPGARLLKDYMKVAKYGPNSLYENETFDEYSEFGSPFEEAVYERLTKKGLILRKQVGVSKYRIDLAVVDPKHEGSYLLGIECDGAPYHAAATARDRDRLRQEILEDKFGWNIHRIWSRDWYADSSKEIAKVLEALKVSPKKDFEKYVKKKASNIEIGKSPIENLPLEKSTNYPVNAKTYRLTRFKKAINTGSEVFFSEPKYKIEQAIKGLVDYEGPIHKEVVKRRIADHFDIRLGKRISNELDRTILSAIINRHVVENGNFLWPVGMRVPPLRIYKKGGSKRDIDEISPEEIGLAIIECVKNSVGISEDGLTKEVARLFGLRVVDSNIPPIRQMVKHLVKFKTLGIRGNKLILIVK